MNLIPEIAKKLGVEIGEKFKVAEYKYYLFWFENENLMFMLNNNDALHLYANSKMWGDILAGKVNIIKLPWKPRIGDIYYCAYFRGTMDKCRTTNFMWNDHFIDFMNFKIGNCFKTEEEVQNHKQEIYDRLTKEKE